MRPPEPDDQWKPLPIQLQVALWDQLELLDYRLRGSPEGEGAKPIGLRAHLKRAQEKALEEANFQIKKPKIDVRAVLAEREQQSRG